MVTCFNDSTGSVIWEYDAFGNIMSRPTIADGMLAIATVQGDLVTLDAATGESLQGIVFDESITSQLITIEYKGDKELMIPKKTDSKAAVVFGTGEGNIYCYDLETLQLLWENKDAEGMIQTKPLVIGDKIIYGAWDGHLYCIDAKKGWLIWRWTERDNFYYSPAACIPVSDGDNVYVCTPEKKVFSVDLQLGKTNWINEKTKAWEAIGITDDKKTLLIKGMEDKFYTIPAKRGKGRLEYNINHELDTMPVKPIEENGYVYFGVKSGKVFRIDLSAKKYRTLFFMGTARVHTVVELGDNEFAVSNMDGKIVVFEYEKYEK
jgi:outer membrane protein assembly factor BamB